MENKIKQFEDLTVTTRINFLMKKLIYFSLCSCYQQLIQYNPIPGKATEESELSASFQA